MVSTPDFESQDPGYESCWRRNSSRDCTMLHYTQPFIIILPFSRYDLNNVERDVKHLGPVVQRVVSLTSLLRVISLTVLADAIYNILIIFC